MKRLQNVFKKFLGLMSILTIILLLATYPAAMAGGGGGGGGGGGSSYGVQTNTRYNYGTAASYGYNSGGFGAMTSSGFMNTGSLQSMAPGGSNYGYALMASSGLGGAAYGNTGANTMNMWGYGNTYDGAMAGPFGMSNGGFGLMASNGFGGTNYGGTGAGLMANWGFGNANNSAMMSTVFDTGGTARFDFGGGSMGWGYQSGNLQNTLMNAMAGNLGQGLKDPATMFMYNLGTMGNEFMNMYQYGQRNTYRMMTPWMDQIFGMDTIVEE